MNKARHIDKICKIAVKAKDAGDMGTVQACICWLEDIWPDHFEFCAKLESDFFNPKPEVTNG